MRIRLGPNGQEEIRRNIHRMSLVSEIAREGIIERANKKFSEETRRVIDEFIPQLAHDEKICTFDGPDYSNGSLGKKVLKSAIMEYYQRHPELIIED